MPPRRAASKPPADESAVLATARAALVAVLADPEPRPLVGTRTAPGLFIGTGQGPKDAADLCVARGWVEPTGSSTGTGKSAKPLYRLTAAGAREALARTGSLGREAIRQALAEVERTLQAVQAAIGPLRAALNEPGSATVAQPDRVASLSEQLRDKYDYLRQLVEFQDGLVSLPRLYHKVREGMPSLTVAQFHAELMALWKARKIELHILNEVRSAVESELGIWWNDSLYYFVLWKDRP